MATADQKLLNLKNDLIRYIQGGHYKKAEKLYPRCKGLNIQDADIWRLFAGVHAKRGNFEEIAHCCRNILKIQPKDYITAYNMGAALENIGRVDEAIQQYENCISINPDYTNAYNSCARLYYLTGNSINSVEYYKHALEKLDNLDIRTQYSQALIASGDTDRALQQLEYVLSKQHNNEMARFLTGQCCYELGNYPDSEKHYRELLKGDAKNIKAINNLGRLLEETGKLEEAAELYQTAINIDDSVSVIHRNLGKALVKLGKIDEAKHSFTQSLKLEPDHPETYFNLGKLYNELNKIDKAKEYLLKALEIDIPAHMEKADEFILATRYFLSSIDSPESFNEDKKAFVADLFDGYAEKFDKHLVEELQYETPVIIADLLRKYVANNTNITLDLGCGTGLCCKHLKKYSNHITGIDLSSKMIDKARELDCYDNLIVGEITEAVNNSSIVFDLIVAADVFVYIGSLQDIFQACSIKATEQGYFVFSTETLPDSIDDKYRLYDSGRYKHSIKYINMLASQYAYSVVEHLPGILRKENGKDVHGNISVLRKTS